MSMVNRCTTKKAKGMAVRLGANLKVTEECGIALLKANEILGLIGTNIVHKRRDYPTFINKS